MKFCYFITIASMMSVSALSDVECDKKRMLNPRQFSNEEFEARREWHDAYYSYKHAKKKTPSIFSKAALGLSKSTRKTFRATVMRAYEQGEICQSERWMKPQRFIEIYKRCQILETALKAQANLQTVEAEFEAAYMHFQQEHDKDASDARLNASTNAFDEYLREQAERKKNGIAQFTMFSIKNFAKEAHLIGEHFAQEREELLKEEMQEKYLKEVFLAREKNILSLRKELVAHLKNTGLLIDEADEKDLQLIYGLGDFSGDLSTVIGLNDLLRKIKTKRVEASHDVKILAQTLDAAQKHFSPHNAELCAQEKMDIYSSALDAMVLAMKYWHERIKDGYSTSLDGLLQMKEPHLQFVYVQEKLQVANGDVAECPFCYDERPLFVTCANGDHQMCADCLRTYFVTRLTENGGAVSCPFLNCENPVHDLDYEKLMAEEIFPYEFFEAYKKRWLRQLELKPNLARCHMNCSFFHEIPHDRVPGQASPPCPDCQTKTCLSCKNLAHVGSMECRAPDAEAMKKAHDEMFKAGYRRCPACGVWGIKVSGCDTISCLCGQVYSFSTGEPWQTKHAIHFGYHHGDVRTPVRINNDL